MKSAIQIACFKGDLEKSLKGHRDLLLELEKHHETTVIQREALENLITITVAQISVLDYVLRE